MTIKNIISINIPILIDVESLNSGLGSKLL